jgi:2-polyprenyl-3-methyl-5-hydroxy-6-metoxy-1,4-benzoquinol methylase
VTSPILDPSDLRHAAMECAADAEPAAATDGSALRAGLVHALRRALNDAPLSVIDAADPDGLFDALERALRTHRFIAVSRALGDARRAMALAHIQHKHRFNLAQTLSWPDADLVLIESRIAGAPGPRDYRGLQSTYDERYFLADCGGYADFLAARGRRLTEVRHHALVALAQTRRGQRILDLGCGRGELAYALSLRGAHVLGLDYASAAIDIAQQTYADIAADSPRFVCADALTWTPPHAFDTIVMADVVEHLEPSMLDALLARASAWLAPGGRLLIHTAPNKLAYRSVWRVQRRQAITAGAWLPKNPRSFHEDLMHINEQTPKRLQRALRRHFANASVWAADEADPALTLRTPQGDGWTQAPFLYAVAAQAALDRASALASLSQAALALPPSLTLLRQDMPPARLNFGEATLLSVTLRNDGTESLSSFAPTPVHIAPHWFHEDGTIALWDGERTRLPGRVAPAETFEAVVKYTAPQKPGRYRLRFAMVQEFVAWHDEAFLPALEFWIDVA